jgi:hypothetical protein
MYFVVEALLPFILFGETEVTGTVKKCPAITSCGSGIFVLD